MVEETVVKNLSQSSVSLEKNSRGYNYTLKVYDFDDTIMMNRFKTLVKQVESEIKVLSIIE